MKCMRCENLPEITTGAFTCYAEAPVSHRQSLLWKLIKDKDYKIEIQDEGYIISGPSFESFILDLGNNTNRVEQKDIKILPLDSSGVLSFKDLINLKSLEDWVDLYESKEILYVLKNKRLVVHFQPIFNTKSLEVYGYEGLIRGMDATGRMISPGLLFEQAKKCNLMFQLDKLARQTVIEVAASLKLEKNLFVNFVPTSIYQPALCLATTKETVERNNFDASKIIFEVVEFEKIEDHDHLNSILNYYKSFGYRTALDDVGMGYATLDNLLKFRPDLIKIDKSIVENIHRSKTKQKRLQKYIETAQQYHMKILVEGIETKGEADFVESLEIDYVQGYYYGKPAPNLVVGALNRQKYRYLYGQ